MVYDQKETDNIRKWLETPAGQRDIPAGALLLLRLNRNRVLYNNILARPEMLLPKLEYELKQYLLIRSDNMTREGIIEMQKEVMPKVAKIVKEPEEYTEGETHWGRREDHDELPEDIRRLFDESAERYKVIKSLYFSLKKMDRNPPCDRYEQLKLLSEAEEKDRKAFQIYDSYGKGGETAGSEDRENAVKEVNAARKFVSENRERLAAMPAGREADRLRTEIQHRVDVVIASGGSFTPDHTDKLRELGIVIE